MKTNHQQAVFQKALRRAQAEVRLARRNYHHQKAADEHKRQINHRSHLIMQEKQQASGKKQDEDDGTLELGQQKRDCIGAVGRFY